MAKCVDIFKTFEGRIEGQDTVIVVNTADVLLAHECVDRRTKRIVKSEEDIEALEKKVQTLERQVGEVPGGLLMTS